MKTLALRFWNDERGFIVSAEVVLIMTIGVLGMIVGINSVASAVNNEMNDISSAFGALDQSYWYSGLVKVRHAGVSGSAFADRQDFCDCTSIVRTVPGAKVQGITPPPPVHTPPPPVAPCPPSAPCPPDATPVPHHPHLHHPHALPHHPHHVPAGPAYPHIAPPENATPVVPHLHGPILPAPCPCPPADVHPHHLKPTPAMPHEKLPKLHAPQKKQIKIRIRKERAEK